MNWKALQQLHQVYIQNAASDKILKYAYIKSLVGMGYLMQDEKLLKKTDYFDEFYKKKHLDKFEHIQKLLIQYDFVTTNLKEDDLEILLKIEAEKEAIIKQDFSSEEFATQYFQNSKYLKTKTNLENIILKILDKEDFQDKGSDQQFLSILHCKSKHPKAILLCENLDLLKKTRLENTELWFAGGSNTAKLAYVPTPKIPMYYRCDWDNNGMKIYQRIKRDFFPKIELIVPKNPEYFSIISEWETRIDESLFTKNAIQLLKHLIENNLWIEEQGITLPTTLSN